MTTHNYRRQAFREEPAIWKTIAATRAYILRAWGAAVLRPYMNLRHGAFGAVPHFRKQMIKRSD